MTRATLLSMTAGTSTLAEVWRGSTVESLHRGSAVVVDGQGKLVAYSGNANFVTFLRSSAKPFQALPLILTGAADHFHFSEAETAIACASHNGEPIHTATVEAMLRKIDLPVTALLCGVHDPYNKSIAEEQKRRGQPASVLQNNCSGKHAGMLATTRHLGEPTETYISPDHKLQRLIHNCIAQFADLPQTRVGYATDGCGVPTFALPLRNMATMFAHLALPRSEWPEEVQAACRRIVHAMVSHPEMIAGNGELDTELMRTAGGKLVSKGGAEGLWCAAVLPNARWRSGLGIAVKIEDGSPRARSVVALDILHQMQVFQPDHLEKLRAVSNDIIFNNRRDPVGIIKPALHLHFA